MNISDIQLFHHNGKSRQKDGTPERVTGTIITRRNSYLCHNHEVQLAYIQPVGGGSPITAFIARSSA